MLGAQNRIQFYARARLDSHRPAFQKARRLDLPEVRPRAVRRVRPFRARAPRRKGRVGRRDRGEGCRVLRESRRRPKGGFRAFDNRRFPRLQDGAGNRRRAQNARAVRRNRRAAARGKSRAVSRGGSARRRGVREHSGNPPRRPAVPRAWLAANRVEAIRFRGYFYAQSVGGEHGLFFARARFRRIPRTTCPRW